MGREEEEAVLEVLRCKRLFRHYGPDAATASKTELFEHRFAGCIGARHALAVNSGTSALITALVAAGIGPGDEVIVPGYTWIATATAVVMSGAVPIIAEIDESLALDPEDVQRRIGPRTKAIIVVHMNGASADLESLCRITRARNIVLIEDVAQACGASYRGARLGTFGHAGAFSFQFNKIITTGEGGMMVCNDSLLWRRAVSYHDLVDRRGAGDGLAADLPRFPGQNYRASELVGALGLVQLQRLEGLLGAIRARHRRIAAGVSGLPGINLRRSHDPSGDACVALTMLVEPARAREFAASLTAENVPARVLYSPEQVDMHVYAHWDSILNLTRHAGSPFARRYPDVASSIRYSADMCPRTLDLCGRAVSIDVNPLMTAEDVEETIEAIGKVAGHLLGG